MVRGHEGVLSWHTDEGIKWRPELIVGYMAKEAMLQTLLRLVDGVCTKGEKSFCKLHNLLDMRVQEVYAGLKA